MKIATLFLSTIAFALSILFPAPDSSAASDLTENEIRGTVKSLINSRGEVHIQGIKIEKDHQGKLKMEINGNLGSCWGQAEFAKEYAREALKALFTSDLPISHVVLNIFESNESLLTVALGKNQASNIKWEEQDSLSSFYDHIRARTNYEGNPADYCLFIEKKDGVSP